MTEYDVPWKEVFDSYLKDFMQLCLPELHDQINWEAEIENKEQELPRLFPESSASGRIADKLFRVQFKLDPFPTWVLIHTEVQVSREKDFARRMFVCYYRIMERFQEPVICIGVIADPSKTWRPSHWEQDLFGCRVAFTYPIIKLQDYWERQEELEASTSPFATVILAHLLSQASAKLPDARYRYKIQMVRRLFETLRSPDDVRRLFRFIDWVIDLPGNLELQFKDEIHQMEIEKQMPYITSIERIAKLEGELKGKIRMLQELMSLKIISDSDWTVLNDDDRRELLESLRERFGKR